MQLIKNSSPFKNPLCVALDVDSDLEALRLAEDLAEIVGGFKIGPRLIHRYGGALIKRISTFAPVFVDCKFFDIESTMESSIRASFEMGASVVTIHAMVGRPTLEKMAKLELELNQIRSFKILAVTILTSWSTADLPATFRQGSVPDHVCLLASEVKSSGLSSIVCSAEDISVLRDLGMFLVTPGIRFDLQEKGDQKRVVTPHGAIQAGASVLVVGRPIVNAKNSVEAAADFLTAIFEKGRS